MKSNANDQRTERLIGTLAVLALIVLSTIAGAWWAWRDGDLFKSLLKPGFIGMESMLRLGALSHDPGNTDVWRTGGPPCETCGLRTVEADRVSPGLTLISAGQSAHLVDSGGGIRHSWSYDFRDLLGDEGVLLGKDTPETWIYWRPAHVLPNGDLLALVDVMHSSPEGVGLIKIDKESGLKWVLHRNFHHDFALDDDGRIYVLDQQIRKWPPVELGQLEGPLIDEGVSVVASDGTLVDRFSLLDAFAASPYSVLVARLAKLNRFPWGDYLHSNNLDIVAATDSQPAVWAQASGLLLSFRNISSLALLDLNRRQIVWAANGGWYWQHDPDLLPNGNILLFDNQGDWNRGGTSRVMEVDLDNQQVVWRYPAMEDASRLWSFHRGEQQKLENGNVLINEFFQGRVIEVTREGEIVWEYHCPFRLQGFPALICRPMWTRRYLTQELLFLSSM